MFSALKDAQKHAAYIGSPFGEHGYNIAEHHGDRCVNLKTHNLQLDDLAVQLHRANFLWDTECTGVVGYGD